MFFYQLACLLSGYVMHTGGGDFVQTHRAMSLRDALAWARCYGPEQSCEVSRFGRMVAMRGSPYFGEFE
jgi:hypothetical protein